MIGLIHVAAAALVDGSGRVLLAERPPGKPLPGLWEFPGGKIDTGETPETALVRELAEELAIGVVADDLQPLAFASHPLAAGHLVLLLYCVRCWTGVPRPQLGQRLDWFTVDDMPGLAMPPADGPLVAALARRLKDCA